jgi:hypothetical protein
MRAAKLVWFPGSRCKSCLKPAAGHYSVGESMQFDSRSVADRTTGRYAVGQVVKEGLDTAKADEKAKAASAAAAAAAAATTAAAPSGAAPSAGAAGPAAAPPPHERPSAPVAVGETTHS